MLKNEDGMSVVMVFGILVLLGLLAFALLNRTVAERQVITHLLRREIAFNAAEGGLERALLELKQDFADDTTGNPSWADGIINGIAAGPGSNYYPLYYYPLYDDTISLGEGSYFVELKNEPDGLEGFFKDKIWVKSTGITDGGGKREIEAYVEIKCLSPWNNAISAGKGQEGKAITGNVKIHGSVHILGEGLSPDSVAIDMKGGAGIRNNYYGMPPALLSRVPAPPTTMFNEDIVQTLEATLRVKHGKVILDGGPTVGELDSYGDTLKETMDGVYVTDGFEISGASKVYSDNGTDNPYDLDDIVIHFPGLFEPYTDPETDTLYSSYLDYLSAKALHIPDTVSEISSNVDGFSYSELGNSITWNGHDSLGINGIIYTDSNLIVGAGNETIKYDGKGTLVSTGDIYIQGHLLSRDTFPTDDALGLIAAKNMYLAETGDPHSNMMGAFYAESMVVVAKGIDVVGSLVSNYFSVSQVPSIYHVPALATNLPPGLPGGDPVWLLRVRTRIR